MRLILAFLTLLLSPHLRSQAIVSGSVSGQDNRNLVGASITAAAADGKILSFAIVDSRGTFRISIPDKADSISITARYMGYRPETATFRKNTSVLDFVLLPSSTDLPEVTVRSQAITRRGDTLSYSVSSFAAQKDRNLADVLSKMPGIEVESGGRILYQGKAITKFYIEGLDLLGGRYSLATDNLPHADVSQVQILESHQPIQMLKSLAGTDDTAINIRLKKGITVTGTAEAGSGLEPLKWEANATPMLFTKQKQFLASLQSNNVGRDIALQNRVLTGQDIEDIGQSDDEGIISPTKLALGDIASRRWLGNNATYISSNALLKGNAGTEYKVNASFLNDNRKQFESSSRVLFLDSGTLSIENRDQFTSTENSVEAGISILKNLKSHYFSNVFKMNSTTENLSNRMMLNGSDISERSSNGKVGFRNDLNSLFSIGNQIVSVKSRLRFQHRNEILSIRPGGFAEIINGGQEYGTLYQNVSLSDFYMMNSASIVKKINAFVFHSEAGLRISNRELQSDISSESSGPGGDSFRNDFGLFHTSYFISIKSEYEYRKWKFRMRVPANYTVFSKTDAVDGSGFESAKLFLEPELFAEYNLSSFWKSNVMLNRKKDFFSLPDLYSSYIVRNYQDITRNSNVLPEKARNNLRLLLAYRNPITSFFTHFAYTLSEVRSNVLTDITVDADGLARTELIYRDNSLLQNSYTATAAKVFDINNLSVNATLNHASTSAQRTINAQDYSIKNTSYSAKLGTSADIFPWFNLEYRLKQDYFQNYSNKRALASNDRQTHQLTANLYIGGRNTLKLSYENYNATISNEKNSANFFDLMYRHTILSKKIDIQLNWDNIFNLKQYRTFSVDELNVTESNFRLRDSQVMLKVYFSL